MMAGLCRQGCDGRALHAGLQWQGMVECCGGLMQHKVHVHVHKHTQTHAYTHKDAHARADR